MSEAEDRMDEIHEAVSNSLEDLRHASFSPLARLGEKLYRYNQGEWTDDDFQDVDRKEVESMLAGGKNGYDIRGIFLYVEPLSPKYFRYKGVRIIGGNGWWQFEDGGRFKVITEAFDHIDNALKRALPPTRMSDCWFNLRILCWHLQGKFESIKKWEWSRNPYWTWRKVLLRPAALYEFRPSLLFAFRDLKEDESGD